MLRLTMLFALGLQTACSGKPSGEADLPDAADEIAPPGGDPDDPAAAPMPTPAPGVDGGPAPAPGVRGGNDGAAAVARPADGGAAAPDASALVIGGPVPPCRFRFCESFESVADGAPPDPKLWQRAGNIVVESGRAVRGSKAMHVRAGSQPTETYVSQAKTLPTLGGQSFYARVYMMIDQRPTDFFHWSFTEARGTDLRGTAVRYGGISTGACVKGSFCRDNFFFQIKPLVYGKDEGGTASDDLKATIAEKTWHCLEWYFDATTRQARLWWNGRETKAGYMDGKQIPFPTFNRFYLGWALYQRGTTGVGWEVWFDELAIHDQRIGCD